MLGSSPTAAPSTSSSNFIKTFAGTGTAASSGTGGPPLAASFKTPTSIWADSAGVYYIADPGSFCIRKIDTSNIVQLYTGVCETSGYSGDGGAASSALLNTGTVMFGSSLGTMYLADYTSHVVRSVSSSGIINTICGNPSASTYTGDGGPASSATIKSPIGVWVDSVGNVYVTCFSFAVVRKIDTSNIITTIAGEI